MAALNYAVNVSLILIPMLIFERFVGIFRSISTVLYYDNPVRQNDLIIFAAAASCSVYLLPLVCSKAFLSTWRAVIKVCLGKMVSEIKVENCKWSQPFKEGHWVILFTLCGCSWQRLCIKPTLTIELFIKNFGVCLTITRSLYLNKMSSIGFFLSFILVKRTLLKRTLQFLWLNFLIVSISAMLTNVLLLMQNISGIFHFLLNYFKGKWAQTCCD